MTENTPNNYLSIVAELKNKISQAKTRAALSVNKELQQVYWDIGNILLEQQKTEAWGGKIIKRLAADLRSEFPEIKGLSERNLLYMRKFASSYPNLFTQQAAAQLKNYFINIYDCFMQVLLVQFQSIQSEISFRIICSFKFNKVDENLAETKKEPLSELFSFLGMRDNNRSINSQKLLNRHSFHYPQCYKSETFMIQI